MARSKNVLNTRFCPSENRNLVDMLCSVLTFTPHNAEDAILPSGKFPRSINGKTNLYALPMSEFNILATETGDGETESRDALGGPSIIIVTKGRGKMRAGGKKHDLDEGYVFFIGVGEQITFEACRGLQIFTAFAE